ncbi:hypothetical protein GCM10025868_25040 [Angustibacter aerolatus]|uniref:Uncharacterized protein n=1 Tax=Angustibacter aerolatus TaxID=1162965 RepID=A0ABQ6JHF3_9ACTN|nr:hypothetical protein GCM10025868_25040 [Angustibacter aerolatus]
MSRSRLARALLDPRGDVDVVRRRRLVRCLLPVQGGGRPAVHLADVRAQPRQVPTGARGHGRLQRAGAQHVDQGRGIALERRQVQGAHGDLR